MWTLQIWVIDLPQPGVLTFKNKELAESVCDGLWPEKKEKEVSNIPMKIEDDFGRTVYIPAADCVGMVELIDQAQYLEKHSLEQMQMAYAQIKHQQKLAADPKLKFLQGVQQQQPSAFPLSGRN